MTQPTNNAAVSEMPSAELAQLAERNRVEQALHGSGCLIGLSFGVVSSWAALLMLPLGPSNAASFFRITAAIAAFLLAPMAGKIFFGYLGNRRGHVYRTELAKRYGKLPWKIQLELTQLSLQPEETAILLRVAAETARSAGQHCELRFTADSGSLRIVKGEEFDFGYGVDPAVHFEVLERKLTVDEAAKLDAAWQAAQATKPRDRPLPDELISEKTQAAVVRADGKIRTWSAHNANAIIKKAGDDAWREFLAVAFDFVDSAQAAGHGNN